MALAQKMFVAHAPYRTPPRESVGGAARGALAGRTVSIKDLFDVQGTQCGFGSPTWLATHPDAAAADATVVRRLLDAGGIYVGKTILDEMAWSLVGENAHYGTPPNTAAPAGRVPGGSSSGAAAAAAANLCDIALGSDTGGSVRIPASHCGLYGMRPTHGRVPLDGARPLAPSLDTAGTLTRTFDDLEASMRVLLGGSSGTVGGDASADAAEEDVRLLALEPCFEHLAPDTRAAMAAKLAPVLDGAGTVTTTDLGGTLEDFANTYRLVQADDIWACHGPWVRATRPEFAEAIAQRFAHAERVAGTPEAKAAWEVRERLTANVQAVFAKHPHTFCVLPAACGPPPACGGGVGESWRQRTLSLSAIASITGCPQVVFPCITTPEGPVGASIMGPRGSDERLLRVARRVVAALNRA